MKARYKEKMQPEYSGYMGIAEQAAQSAMAIRRMIADGLSGIDVSGCFPIFDLSDLDIEDTEEDKQ